MVRVNGPVGSQLHSRKFEMGSAYEDMSREELLALLEASTLAARAQYGSEPPSSGDRYRQIPEGATAGSPAGALDLAASEQRKKLEALGKLAGGVAHDFNNILVAIFSYADLTDLDAEDPQQVRSYMDGLRVAAHRARDLVQQLLVFSSHGGQQHHKISLPSIVDETLRSLRSTLLSSVELRAEIDDDVPEVLGTPAHIHQALMNLCLNAARAMGARGVLSVRLSCTLGTDELLRRVPDLLAECRYARLVVQDDGEGMDSATLSRIFEPSFTTKPGGEGFGLGLAVVQGVIKSHGGAIAVSSAPGTGTTFELYLPAAD